MSSSGKHNSKRLARAKVKPTEGSATGEKDSRPAPKKKTPAQARADRKKRVTSIVIIVFAVIMAVSMMMPSCSAIVGNNQASESAKKESTSSNKDDSSSSSQKDDSSSSSSKTASTSDSLKKLDSSYEESLASLQKRLKKNPKDLAALLNLGNGYMSWGYQAASLATTDADKTHVNDILAKAIDYFDQYLELNDSDTVKVNRALCQFHQGDTDAALQALRKVTEDSPKFPLGWANLGMVYEYKGQTGNAQAAYKKAEKTDPKDSYGAKSFAEQRLSAIESAASSSASGSSSTTNTTTGTSGQGLSGALGGLGLSGSGN